MIGRASRLALALSALGVMILLQPTRDLRAAPGSKRQVVVPRPPAETVAEMDGVQIAGHDSTVLGTSAVDEWTIVVAIDPPLSTADGARLAAELLAARAEQLSELGGVRLMVVDTLIDERLSSSRDPAAIGRALGSIPAVGAFGEVSARRAGFSPQADRLERLEQARDEQQLIRWQREALVDWLLTAEIAPPKALFLLQNGYDLAQQEAYALSEPLDTGSPSPTLDDRLLGPSLAAAGWVVFPLDLDASAKNVRPAEGHQALARETGGRVVANAEDLEHAIDSLRGATVVTLDVPTLPTGPLPLDFPQVASGMSPPRWLGGTFLPGRAAARARLFLNEGAAGGLDVEASLHYLDADGGHPAAQNVVIEVRADLDPPGSPPSSEWLSVGLYLDQVDAPPLQVELQGTAQPLTGVDRWVTQAAVLLPEDPGELVAVVNDGLTGRWGAARVEDEGSHLVRSGPGLAVEQFDLRPVSTPEDDPEAPTVISLLTPRGNALKGNQRFRTLVASPNVAKVVFSLDGETVATDDDAPFAARIDLGGPVGRHTVSIDAFDVMGNLIGADSVRLNEPARSFDVSIAEVRIDEAAARVSFTAEVAHPTDIAVERVEFYYNEQLLGTSSAPPWVSSSAIGTIGQTDYVRAVAYFADGRNLEDVRLLSALGTNEAVEVNLVQVYVVATDKQGEPVADLTADDFEVSLRGRPQALERFAYADEVPLSLALTIDTSGSMYALMPDTITAAARFLTQLVSDKDNAMIVDFGDQARTRAPLTDDIGLLLTSLGGIDADLNSMTALYDSVIYSALELPEGQGRKAVVLLSDGADTRSRFSLGRAIDTAKQVGAPVYVVSLVGIHDPRRGGRRPDVTALTAQTGGEAFYLDAMSELNGAYDRIAGELRSQYLLAFPTSEKLTQADIDSIRVKVSRPGLELRTVVGGRSVE